MSRLFIPGLSVIASPAHFEFKWLPGRLRLLKEQQHQKKAAGGLRAQLDWAVVAAGGGWEMVTSQSPGDITASWEVQLLRLTSPAPKNLHSVTAPPWPVSSGIVLSVCGSLPGQGSDPDCGPVQSSR